MRTPSARFDLIHVRVGVEDDLHAIAEVVLRREMEEIFRGDDGNPVVRAQAIAERAAIP